MVEEALRKIGLTEGEIKIYLSLLELGSSSSGKITKRSGISGSKVYEVLDRLMGKGLANSVVKNGVKHFEASDPSRILDYLDEKNREIEDEKNDIQKILPELILKQQSAPRSKVRVFTGFEGLKTANEDIINTLSRGEEWLSMGLSEQPKSLEVYFTKRQKIREKKGIIIKHLLNEKYRELYRQRKDMKGQHFRFLPREFEMPSSIEIYKNKIIIMILLKEDPMAIMIESGAVSGSFRKYFEALWKTAKKA